MRGHNYLKKSGRQELISDLKMDLSNEMLEKVSRTASSLFFCEGRKEAELIVRQYLMVRVCGRGMTKAILLAYGSQGRVLYPLPKLWQAIFVKHGIPIAPSCCTVLWVGLMGMFWGYGFLSFVRRLGKEFRALCGVRVGCLERYSYFERLAVSNLPRPCKDGRSYNIISWYAQWEGRSTDLAVLRHGVCGVPQREVNGMRVEYSDDAIPNLGGVDNIIRFFGHGVLAIVVAGFDIFRGRWWNALVLSESLRSIKAQLVDPECFARDYLFHNSGWIYRPLWTYVAEAKGARILFYYYSTNIAVFKREDGYPKQHNSCQLMNWPEYLVWDKCQMDFVRRETSATASVKVVGPIWFSSAPVEMPDLPRTSVAVFDVQPQRSSLRPLFGAPTDYYTARTSMQFLLDIDVVLREHGVCMVHKKKRCIGNRASLGYSNLVDLLSGSGAMISVDADVSACRVIEQCAAVISMPFTSTALLGIKEGKPSVYYDPHGIVQKDDRSAREILIISGRDELRKWVRERMLEL